MKTLQLVLLFIAVIGLSPVTETKAQVSVSVNFSTFQRELSPHGRWMTNPRFGEVWIYNDPGFKPYYTDGHWEYTNYGWAWVSDFDWGWAPFHYGRWEYDPGFGWMWIPGYDWGAAWVSWSSYDDYYGWAPLGYGVNVNVSFGSIPYDRWTFIPRRNICDRDINRYYVSPDRNRGFRNAVVINNYYEGNGGRGRFMRGPDRNEVQRFTSNRIQERRIDDRERQGRWTAGNNNRNGNDNNRVRGNNDRQVNAGDNQRGNNNNFPGRRNDANNNGNGRRNNDQPVTVDNNQRGNNNNFPGRRNDANNNGNGRRNNDQPVTVDNNQRGNNNNFPRRRDDANANNQQQNNQRFPGNNNNGQSNFPQRQQQVERPVRQQPSPDQQPRQMQQRNDQGGNGRSWQGGNGNNGQGGGNNGNGGGGHGRGRRG